MSFYVKPSEKRLAVELAKEMGDNVGIPWLGWNFLVTYLASWGAFKPHKVPAHSKVAVQVCVNLGLKEQYELHLARLCKEYNIPHILFVTPIQESYAAHRTLWEHNNKSKPC